MNLIKEGKMFNNILNKKRDDLLKEYLREINKVKQINVAKIYQLTKDTIDHFNKKPLSEAKIAEVKELEHQWYEGLRVWEEADYSVYGDDRYLADLFLCYFFYARKYIKDLFNPKSYLDLADFEAITNAVKWTDVGAGFGLGSISILQQQKNAHISATNLRGTIQYDFLERVAEEYAIDVYGEPEELSPTEILFASEYFEHFEEPIDHLRELIKITSPEYVVMANAFGADSIGHFDYYRAFGRNIPGKKIGRMFNQELRRMGYAKVPTKMWNNRPAIYKKEDLLI